MVKGDILGKSLAEKYQGLEIILLIAYLICDYPPCNGKIPVTMKN